MNNRADLRESFEYTDNDAGNLLDGLAKYAEAFAGDHPEGLTVLALVDDLVTTCQSGNERFFEKLQERIHTALAQ